MGILELELDDWLDPSLPKMYQDEELGHTNPALSDDFTSNNEEFQATPPYLPVQMVHDTFLFMRRE